MTIGEKSFTKFNANQEKTVHEATQHAMVYERTLMLADEQKLESELKVIGMIFVDTDQASVTKEGKVAVLAAAHKVIKPIFQSLFSD